MKRQHFTQVERLPAGTRLEVLPPEVSNLGGGALVPSPLAKILSEILMQEQVDKAFIDSCKQYRLQPDLEILKSRQEGDLIVIDEARLIGVSLCVGSEPERGPSSDA